MVADYQAAPVWQNFASITLSTANFTLNANDIKLYPNPASDILTIGLDNYEFESLTIYNSLGQPVLKSNNTQVAVSTLATGIYYVAVLTTKGSGVKKLVIK